MDVAVVISQSTEGAPHPSPALRTVITADAYQIMFSGVKWQVATAHCDKNDLFSGV